MTINLPELKQNSSRELMKGLLRLKNLFKSPEELNNTLVDLHTAFLKFSSFFRNKENPDVQLLDKHNNWNIYIYIDNNNNKHIIRILFHLNTVVCVESSFLKLESILLKKQEIEILPILKTFLKYKNDACNICGRYFIEPYYEIPTKTIEHADYTYILHESCTKDNLNINNEYIQ